MMQSNRLLSLARGAAGSAAAPMARTVAKHGVTPARKATLAAKSLNRASTVSKFQTSASSSRSYST